MADLKTKDSTKNGSFIGQYEVENGVFKMMIADGPAVPADNFPRKLAPAPGFMVFTFRRDVPAPFVSLTPLADWVAGFPASYLTVRG